MVRIKHSNSKEIVNVTKSVADELVKKGGWVILEDLEIPNIYIVHTSFAYAIEGENDDLVGYYIGSDGVPEWECGFDVDWGEIASNKHALAAVTLIHSQLKILAGTEND